MNSTDRMISYALTISLALAIVGSFFKLMHLPGANILLVVGLGSTAIATFAKYLLEKNTQSTIKGTALALGAIGVLFKLMHWPNADLLVKLALAAALLLVFSMFWFKQEEE